MTENTSNPDTASASKPPSSFVRKGDRLFFNIELRSEETTIVSWKKLLKDANIKDNNASSSVHEQLPKMNPALEARIAPVTGQAEINEQDAPQTHRFSAVIEKIERLYMGKDSSDEEEDVPGVHDDQYDTADSFIDDTELDEYFEVDNSAIKHDGFFVNRGKLERKNEPPVLADQPAKEPDQPAKKPDQPAKKPNQPAKKRCRNDTFKNPGENVDGHVSNKRVKVGNTAAGKTASLPVKNTFDSSQNLAVPGEPYEDLKSQNQLEVSGVTLKKKKADIRPILDPSVCLKVSNNDVFSVVAAKDADKHKTGVLQSKNTADKYKDTSGVHETSHQKDQGKNVYAHSKSQPGRTPSSVDLENTGRSKVKNSMHELPDHKLSAGKSVMQTPKSENILKKDFSSVRSKSTMLENAIQDLEKMVAESRPPTMENQEVDSTSQVIKRRMPMDIKLKLAKVARLAQASQGKVSQELIKRLMGILGHLIQLRTLKRNLKIMIDMGLSAQKEKDARFQQMKKEVVEMIKMLAPSMESQHQQQAGDQELGPDGKAISKRIFSMDTALEEKICDLYDLFVEGLDETAGPLIRKLYVELAELWPNGCMDNHGIKRAICRAKERRRALQSRNKEQENIKRKKLLVPKQEEKVQSVASPQQNMRERLAPESKTHTSLNKAVSNEVTDVRVRHPPVNGAKKEKPKQSSRSPDDVRVAVTDAQVRHPPVNGAKKAKAKQSSSFSPDDVMVAVTDARVLHPPVNALKKEKAKLSSSCSPDDVRVAVTDARVLHPPVNALKKDKVKRSASCSPDDVRVAVTDAKIRHPPVNGAKKAKANQSSSFSPDDVMVAVTDAQVIHPPMNVPRKEKAKLSSSCSPDDVRVAVTDARVLHPPVNALKKDKAKRSASCSPDDVRVAVTDARVLHPPVNALKKDKAKRSASCSPDDVRVAVTDSRVLHPPVNALKKDKAKRSASCSPDDVRVADGVLIKKVKKRKAENELEGTRFRPEKLASLKEGDRPGSQKQSAGVQPKSNLPPTSLPGFEQSS